MNFTGPMADFGKSLNQSLLRMGGFEEPAPVEEKASSSGRAPLKPPPAMSLNTQLWLGARLPFAAFISILGIFTYAYHMSPALPWLLVFLCVDFAVLVAWPTQISNRSRTFWDFGPILSWLLAVGFAVVLGLGNYAIISGWVNATFLQEYNDVTFNTNPGAVVDGGILNFASGTTLASSQAAGYKQMLQNFCAAPIVSASDAKAAPVAFWAVGQECCDSNGGFTCDGAGDTGAHSGMPIRAHTIGPEWTANYNKAIKKAAGANGLKVAKETVFVMWVNDPHGVGKTAWWFATTCFFLLSLVGVCSCCACQLGFRHISEMEQQ